MLDTVKIPKEFEPVFEKAQEYVSRYFKEKKEDPSKGTIEIFGERYILIRAASMSVDFFETVKNLYKDQDEKEAVNVARQLLFDVAHAIGKEDAKSFHDRMKLKDPMEKFSAGPIHFSHSGWAFVDILPESKPSVDEGYYLIYDHPFSFESDAWEKSGKKSDFPVCIMNAGYSSGWCEESFGINLVASEIMCKAKGDEICRFIMAPPSKVEGHIKDYIKKEQGLAKKIIKYEIPGFFKAQQREWELQRVNELKQALLASIPFGMDIVDEEGNILFMNEKLESIFGKEAIGKKCWELYREDKKQCDNCPLKKGVKIDKTTVLEAEGCFGGKTLQITHTGMMYKNKRAILEIFQDITERKKVGEELAKLSRAIEQSPSIITITDAKGNIEYSNPKFTQLTGYTSEEVIGKNPRFLKSGELTQEIYEQLWHTIAAGKEWRGEFRNRKKNGEFYWEAASISAVKDSKGKISNFIKVAEDITERRKTQEALIEERNRLETITENIGVGVTLISKDYRTIWANNVLHEMYGEVEGKICYSTYNQQSDICPWCGVREVFETGKDKVVTQTTGKDKHGNIVWYEIFVTPVKNSSGDIIAALELIIPITERKKSEEQLKHKIHDLEVFHKSAVGRELKMVELKKRVKELEEQVRRRS